MAGKNWKNKLAKIFKKASKGEGPKNLKDIRVAIIADEFTYNSFKYEFIPITVTPQNWQEKFDNEKPDIFFCESAWLGYDEEGIDKPWRGKIYKYYSNRENRKDLLDILEYCRKNSIPTVFWNKEDPPHYRTEKYSYAETANEFDYIFTTSDKCVSHYVSDFNHPHVNTLMFAGQPKLFNPLNTSGEKIDKVVFAGSYYTNHPERIRLMDMIFDKILEQWGDMMIFDRLYYEDWADYPERFLKYTVPPITYEQTAEVYKKMDWGLNFNIVTDSYTMFARRVFELALCYVNILTNYSKGVDRIFADNVFVFDEIDRLPDYDNPYTQKRLDNLYNVLENHTYTQRWKQVLDTIGFEYIEDENDITVIFKSNDIDAVVDKFESIDYDNKVLAVICDDDSIKGKYPQIKHVFKTKDQIRNALKTEFWMICDTDIEDDFIRHAILHYQYLEKDISIRAGDEKFTLSVESTVENKVINRKNLHYLDGGEVKINTYTI